MSLQPQAVPPVPEETARVARAIFPSGNRYMQLRDALGAIYSDEQFAALYPAGGQFAEQPWRIALVLVMQYMENYTDRQAAEAMTTRIDWKYVLSLELTDPGFDFSVLSEFRQRLLASGQEEQILSTLLQICRERGWLKERGKQRTDSTHVMAAIRTMNRLECVGETLRAALNSLAAVVPDWVRAFVPVEWYERYSDRIEDFRMPKEASKRHALAEQMGQMAGLCSRRCTPVRLHPGSGKSQQSRCCGGSGCNSLHVCRSRCCGAPMTTSLQLLC